MKKYFCCILIFFILIFFNNNIVLAFEPGDDFGVYYNENLSLSYGDAYGDGDQESAWNLLFSRYKGVITGIMGFATLTFVVLFIMNFMKLGTSSSNAQERSKVLSGLLWTGIASAGCGGVTVMIALTYSFFN